MNASLPEIQDEVHPKGCPGVKTNSPEPREFKSCHMAPEPFSKSSTTTTVCVFSNLLSKNSQLNLLRLCCKVCLFVRIQTFNEERNEEIY